MKPTWSMDTAAMGELRYIANNLRQIESANYHAAMERASREIQHDSYRLERLIHDLQCGPLVDADDATLELISFLEEVPIEGS